MGGRAEAVSKTMACCAPTSLGKHPSTQPSPTYPQAQGATHPQAQGAYQGEQQSRPLLYRNQQDEESLSFWGRIRTGRLRDLPVAEHFSTRDRDCLNIQDSACTPCCNQICGNDMRNEYEKEHYPAYANCCCAFRWFAMHNEGGCNCFANSNQNGCAF